MADHAEVINLLRRIANDVAALRAERTRHAPAANDAAVLELLGAIHEAVATRAFTTRDLVERAALPRAWRLQVAIASVVGRPSSPARVLGKALRRIDGVNFGGLSVKRIGDDRAGALWMVAPTARVC